MSATTSLVCKNTLRFLIKIVRKVVMATPPDNRLYTSGALRQ